MVDLCSFILPAVSVHAEPGPISLAGGILISGCVFFLGSVKYSFFLYCLLPSSVVGRESDFWYQLFKTSLNSDCHLCMCYIVCVHKLVLWPLTIRDLLGWSWLLKVEREKMPREALGNLSKENDKRWQLLLLCLTMCNIFCSFFNFAVLIQFWGTAGGWSVPLLVQVIKSIPKPLPLPGSHTSGPLYT